jgi:hypothetical protein
MLSTALGVVKVLLAAKPKPLDVCNYLANDTKPIDETGTQRQVQKVSKQMLRNRLSSFFYVAPATIINAIGTFRASLVSF